MDAIVAVYQDWGIGANGTQPVTLSADRRYFREKTQGAWVIVGRKTLADFPGGRPLPNRTTVVLSRSCRSIAGAQVVSSAQEAVRATAGGSPVFVIGGAAVYRSMLPYCSRVYVTRVEACPVSTTISMALGSISSSSEKPPPSSLSLPFFLSVTAWRSISCRICSS